MSTEYPQLHQNQRNNSGVQADPSLIIPVSITGLKSVKNWEIERDECLPEKIFFKPR